MSIPRQCRFFLVFGAVLTCLACSPVTGQTGSSPRDLKPLLENAFALAFSTGQEFQSTRLFDCLGYSPEQVKAIVEVTPRPATLSVEFEPDPAEAGKFRRLRVVAQGVHYYNLLIQQGTLDFSDASLDQGALDQGRLEFRKIARVGIETRVASADILKVFNFFSAARQLSRLKLSIHPKETTLSGKVRRGLFVANFSVSGSAEVDKPKQVRFNCRRMIINGLSLPRAAIRAMFNHVNPVFDARKTWLNLELENVINEEGTVLSIGSLIGPASSSSPVSPPSVATSSPDLRPHPLPLPLPLRQG